MSWQHNLSKGACAQILQPSPLLKKIAVKAAEVLGLSFCSVDIFELENGSYKVLEINAGVTIEKFALQSKENYRITEQIYEKVICDLLRQ